MTKRLPLDEATTEPEAIDWAATDPATHEVAPEATIETATTQRPPWRIRVASLRRLSFLWPWLGLGWMVAILLVGLPMAARVAGEPLLGDALTTYWTESLVEAAIVVYAVVLVPMLLARLLVPQLALPMGAVAVVAVVLTFAEVLGHLPAVVIVAAQTVLAWFVGLGVVSLAMPRRAGGLSLLTWAAVAFAAGNGILGLAYLGLGSFGLISGGSLVAVSVALAAAAALVLSLRGRSEMWWPRPVVPSLLETVLVALVLAFATWAVLFAFVPETLSDAVRHHLPITREIWLSGTTAEFEWWTSFYPIHAQLVTVPAWAVAGVAGVTLSHSIVGIAAALGSAALAEQLAGRRAAAVAFAAFVATPLFLWEIGHAYVDLYPAMFLVAGAVGVVLWQRFASLGILVLAGFLAGLAFASKTTAATGVGALGIAVLLVGRERFSIRSRLAAGLAVAGGGLLITPWLWRSYQITGQFPGLDLLTSTLLGTDRAISQDLGDFGVGRGPLDLATIPWAVTFQGELFGQNGAGALGLLLLMAAPLAIFAPRTRSLAFVLLLVGVGALAWAFTAQYLRYSLPLAAVLAALAGVGVASLGAAFARRGLRWMAVPMLALVGVAVVASVVMSLPARRNQVPLEFFTGQLTAEELTARRIVGFDVLQASSELVGAREPLLWVGGAPGGIYTEAHVSDLRHDDVGERSREVMETLAAEGIEYLIWDLDSSSPAEWASRIVAPGFLRGHSELVLALDHTYLFRLGDELRWEQGPDVLPSLEVVSPVGDWVPRGDVRVSEAGVEIPPGQNIKAVVPVESGGTYALRLHGVCESRGDIVATILWKDEDGVTIGRDRQRMIPHEDGPVFILTTTAEGSVSGVVHLATLSDTCTVASASMRQILNAPE